MSAVQLRKWLEDHTPDSALRDLGDHLLSQLPESAEFATDRWNIIDWKLRPGNGRKLLLYFDRIAHADLRIACKVWVLHGRHTARIGVGSATDRVTAMRILDEVLGARSFRKLNNADFMEAARRSASRHADATAYGTGKTLEALAKWLNVRTGLRLSYVSCVRKAKRHGRRGTTERREGKLLPDEVIRDLVASNLRGDLSDYDRFYLQVFVLNVAAGLRVGELAYLPADCLLEENGALQLLYVPEKGGRPIPKVIPPSLAPAVRKAVESLQLTTKEMRHRAGALRAMRPLDWRKISDDEGAAAYFVAKFAHEWTSAPQNQLITPGGIWHRWQRRYLDVLGELASCHGNKSEVRRRLGIASDSLERMLRDQRAAQEGRIVALTTEGRPRTSLVNDRRAINAERVKWHTKSTVFNRYASIRAIVAEAQTYQRRGEPYPAPEPSPDYEDRFRRSFVLVKDSVGRTVLEAHQALLLKPRHGKEGDFLAITANDLAKWLYKKNVGSVFERLSVIDPRTGATAKFTWHDVRHWLDTQYERGGLSQQQIAMIFGRKDVRQNAIYDQTPSHERAARLQAAVRTGEIVGLVADTYSRLADVSREQAETYLAAALRMVNIMPHGLCTLNWAMTPCPHFLSCFTCGGEESNHGPCEHLIVDGGDSDQVSEVRRLRSEAQTALTVVPPESPMHDRYLRVFTNTSRKLERMGVGDG